MAVLNWATETEIVLLGNLQCHEFVLKNYMSFSKKHIVFIITFFFHQKIQSTLYSGCLLRSNPTIITCS